MLMSRETGLLKLLWWKLLSLGIVRLEDSNSPKRCYLRGYDRRSPINSYPFDVGLFNECKTKLRKCKKQNRSRHSCISDSRVWPTYGEVSFRFTLSALLLRIGDFRPNLVIPIRVPCSWRRTHGSLRVLLGSGKVHLPKPWRLLSGTLSTPLQAPKTPSCRWTFLPHQRWSEWV